MDDIFEQIFSGAPVPHKSEEYYKVTLSADKLGFLKMFLIEQRQKLEEAYRNCETDDEDTPWNIERVLMALDGAEKI